jgi:Domain of unknown function (DUF4351)
MTRTLHDQFAKAWMQELLVDFGKVKIEVQINAEVRKVDVYFQPYTIASPAPEKLIGCFGKMLKTPALIEPFRNAVSPDSVEDCFDKLLTVRGMIRRKAKRDKRKLLERERPRLWIISPTLSQTVIEATGAVGKRGWPQGIYFLPDIQRTALIAVHQLPVNIDTLWLRLFGKGKVQIQAVKEVLALDDDHPYKDQTIEHLARLQMTLETRQNENRLFKEVVMNLSPVYDAWQEKTLAQGREQGRAQGREQGISLGKPMGQVEVLQRQLTAKLDRISPKKLALIDQLNSEQLSSLAIALLSFDKMADFDAWLTMNLA